jgi:hypothetical protein
MRGVEGLMIPPLHYRIIPAVTAFFAALLAIFLTPRFQHYCWKRQKREELRLAVITEINRLAAAFQTSYLFKGTVENTPESLIAFAKAWASVNGQVKDLFSESTCQTFEHMYAHAIAVPLLSKQEIMDRVPRVTEFKVRNTAMRALYAEIGLMQGETQWSRFKRWFNR